MEHIEVFLLSLQLDEEKSACSSRKNRVLVIDDDKSILDSFVRILKKAGFEADTAETGLEAISKINAKDYEVVLFDFRLPDINGLQVACRVRNRLRNTVKIMITGYPTAEAKDQARKEGIYAYTSKPIRPNELILYINQMLEDKSRGKETL